MAEMAGLFEPHSLSLVVVLYVLDMYMFVKGAQIVLRWRFKEFRPYAFLHRIRKVPDSTKPAEMFSHGNLVFFERVPGRLFGPFRAYFAILILTKVGCFPLLGALSTATGYRTGTLFA